MPIALSSWRIDVNEGEAGYFVAAPPHPAFVLVGLCVRTGAWLDAVTPIYSELLDDGRLGAEVMGPRFGGLGGTGESLIRASPGHLIVGIQTRGGAFVDALRLAEASWDGRELGVVRWTAWTGGDRGAGIERRPFLTAGAEREVLVGICGRARSYVEALSGVAATVHRISSAPLARAQRSEPAVG